jgi:hypothetical protein
MPGYLVTGPPGPVSRSAPLEVPTYHNNIAQRLEKGDLGSPLDQVRRSVTILGLRAAAPEVIFESRPRCNRCGAVRCGSVRYKSGAPIDAVDTGTRCSPSS